MVKICCTPHKFADFWISELIIKICGFMDLQFADCKDISRSATAEQAYEFPQFAICGQKKSLHAHL
jgi:hypothetical protein